MSLKTFIFPLLLLAVTWGVAGAQEPAGDLLRQRLQQLVDSKGEPLGQPLELARLASFYRKAGYQSVWRDVGLRQEAIARLRSAADDGLDPQHYHPAIVDRLAGLAEHQLAPDEEFRLSDAMLDYLEDLRFGRVDPASLIKEWNYPEPLDRATIQDQLLNALRAGLLGPLVESLRPPIPQYQRLMDSLRDYRHIAERGGWHSVGGGSLLRPGMDSPRIVPLRRRLAITGDLPLMLATDGSRYDTGLERAVLRFQRRHGLKEDFIVGPQTLAALNVPVERRIAQLRANLERLRWLAHDLPESFLVVDIAGFHAYLVRDGRTEWSSRIIIGRPYRKTPEFRSRMSALVLNPDWTVPPTILRDDILPALRRDPAYLQREGYLVTDHEGRPVDASAIDWTKVSAKGFPYRLVKPPGGDNPLGQVKFTFPNPYFVFMHDTSSRNLFDSSERALSSGCIRVERPLELAVRLLKDNPDWDRQRLEADIASGQTRTVPLKTRLPLLLVYVTATVDSDGEVHFREDLYQRDDALLAALDRIADAPAAAEGDAR